MGGDIVVGIVGTLSVVILLLIVVDDTLLLIVVDDILFLLDILLLIEVILLLIEVILLLLNVWIRNEYVITSYLHCYISSLCVHQWWLGEYCVEIRGRG